MEINISIPDNEFELFKKSRQVNDSDAYMLIENIMTDAFEKSIKGLVCCPVCFRVFKKVFSSQMYCSDKCSGKYGESQPELPFGDEIGAEK